MATVRQRRRTYDRRRHHQAQAAEKRRLERERVKALTAGQHAALAGRRPEDLVDVLGEYERERAARGGGGEQLQL